MPTFTPSHECALLLEREVDCINYSSKGERALTVGASLFTIGALSLTMRERECA